MLSPTRPQLASCTGGVPCTPLVLHRPWWRRLLDAAQDLRARQARRTSTLQPVPQDPSTWRDRDLLSLRGLSPGTLRDIGAPEWVREAAYRDRQPPSTGHMGW